jgi:hypothetical protein
MSFSCEKNLQNGTDGSEKNPTELSSATKKCIKHLPNKIVSQKNKKKFSSDFIEKRDEVKVLH